MNEDEQRIYDWLEKEALRYGEMADRELDEEMSAFYAARGRSVEVIRHKIGSGEHRA